MSEVAWLTDIHLNCLSDEHRAQVLSSLSRSDADAFLIGGDIGEARSVVGYLRELEAAVARPIYFVLGNHDFYGGSIARVRSAIAQACRESRHLTWLPDSGVIELAPGTGLVGHDGWADGRFGDYELSDVVLNDHLLIEELAPLDVYLLGTEDDKATRLVTMQELADEAAEHIRRVLPQTLGSYRHVVVLTHVPPFREACWHWGKISDDDWLPHFSCKSVGDVLVEVMQDRPGRGGGAEMPDTPSAWFRR
jgi:Icc protein